MENGPNNSISDFIGSAWNKEKAKEVGWSSNDFAKRGKISFETKSIPECFSQATSANIIMKVKVVEGIIEGFRFDFSMHNMHAGLRRSYEINQFMLTPDDRAKAIEILEKTVEA